MTYPLAALALRPSTFDPVGVLQTAASMQSQQTQNQTAQLRMAELQEEMRENRDRRGALGAFRTAGGMQNPAALSHLAGQPELFTSVQTAMTAQQAAARQANARGAMRVMGLPEGSREQADAWREELDNARNEGRITPDTYQRYASLPTPPRLLLESLVQQAQAIPSAGDQRRDRILEDLGLPGARRLPVSAVAPPPGVTVAEAAAPPGPTPLGAPRGPATVTGVPPPLVPPAAEPAMAAAPPVQPSAPPAQMTLRQRLDSFAPDQRGQIALLMAEGKTEDALKLIREFSNGGMNPRQTAETEEGLRKEVASLFKPYGEVRDAFTRIETAARNPSPAGDLALIFNFMKMLDPGSVVREGEFATAQNAAGVPDRIMNLYNRMVAGERLNPTQRDDFTGQARSLMTAQERQYLAIQRQYEGIARRMGINPQNVMIDYTRPPPSAQDSAAMLTEARQAIASGKDPAAVRKRLGEMGIDPRGLDVSDDPPGSFDPQVRGPR